MMSPIALLAAVLPLLCLILLSDAEVLAFVPVLRSTTRHHHGSSSTCHRRWQQQHQETWVIAPSPHHPSTTTTSNSALAMQQNAQKDCENKDDDEAPSEHHQIDARRNESSGDASSYSSSSSSKVRRTLLSWSAATLAALTLGGKGGENMFLPSMVAHALSSEETSRIAVFEKAAPAVVFIDTFAERRDQFTTNLMEIPIGSGSGFVWDKQGHIVTNYHLVRNAQVAQIAILSTPDTKSKKAAIQRASQEQEQQSSNNSVVPYTSMRTTTTTSGGAVGDGGILQRSVFKARVVGVDPGKDIAVLKVDAPPELLQPIAVGTSRNLLVGQSVLAIGNPFSLSRTLTTGVVSGLGREVKSPIGRPISNVIQTDASINPGNSGGPLLDSSGKLIGMNTAIFSPSGASAGIGFAIPIDTVKYIVNLLIKDGQIVRPVIGITYLESKQARSLGINSGVLVLDVPEGSAAAKAGLKGTRRTESGLIEIGDIIVKVDKITIEREADLFRALEDLKPGDTVDITVNRLAAANDELTVKTLVVTVELQSSIEAEKRLQRLYIGPLQQSDD